jgi:hypothetical protein
VRIRPEPNPGSRVPQGHERPDPQLHSKPSPETSNTEALATVVADKLRDEGHPVAYGKVAGVVVTGNEDGAHHVISEVMGALIDIGFTIPAQALDLLEPRPRMGEERSRRRFRPRESDPVGRSAGR